ncbi:MAG: hypothetical protein LAO78_00425 [Acidobacteriia bacterium]|nr:hypothetical protein [Terriglobia bacterium]
MSSYKKAVSRLLVLGALIVGALSLSQPTRAYAFTCLDDCLNDYQQCVQQGLLGCDEVYIACVNRCQ